MILKTGSKGSQVALLQEFLELPSDGIFGSATEAAVKEFQQHNGLESDGIVGPSTWDAMGIGTTDDSEKAYETDNGLLIHRYFLPQGEYKDTITKKNMSLYITPQDGIILTNALTSGAVIQEVP